MSRNQIIVVLLMLLGTPGLSQPLNDDDFDNNEGLFTPHKPTGNDEELVKAPKKKRIREPQGPDFGEQLFRLPAGVDEAQWLAEVAAEREELKRQREERDEEWPTPLQAQFNARMAEPAPNPLREALRILGLRAAAGNACGNAIGQLGF